MIQRLIVLLIAKISISWALAYLTGKQEYMGSKWMNENLYKREGR